MAINNSGMSKASSIDQLIAQYEKAHKEMDPTSSLHSQVTKTYELCVLYGHTHKSLHANHVKRFELEVNEHTNKKANNHTSGWGMYATGSIKIICVIAKAITQGPMASNTIFDGAITALDLTKGITDNKKQENLTHDDHNKSTYETRRQEHSAEKRAFDEKIQKAFNDMQSANDKKGQLFSTMGRA